MTDKAAIAAQVVDIQNDRMHKGFIKVTIHVPAECGQQLTAAMGWPTYTTPVPVAIARLNPETERKVVRDSDNPRGLHAGQGQHVGPSPDKTPPASGPDIQARARNRYAQRAGILCNDPLFRKYLELNGRWKPVSGPIDKDIAAAIIRDYCGVDSRADIIVGTEAATRFDLIESAFVCWRDAPELADAS